MIYVCKKLSEHFEVFEKCCLVGDCCAKVTIEFNGERLSRKCGSAPLCILQPIDHYNYILFDSSTYQLSEQHLRGSAKRTQLCVSESN